MEYAAVILSGATQQLQKLFGTETLQHTHNLQDLQQKLAQAVLYLLQKDLNRLLNILYRIDVDERKVKQAMLAPTEEEVADHIAQIIIKRELQKAQTRFIYRSN
ncbi:hypothetical protein H8S95_14510 [Pontibacter sp. KCTC 32443]|uniref:hypothetical protein n=1 Tax=Pontibacter TaxID=323449 RepID=UPI00164E72D4|nr:MULTISPECIES: hypothetical protein [Pontibacter]MBC5775288.1 hypothetical protein [Pontibacter sp. KCTC 32443]